MAKKHKGRKVAPLIRLGVGVLTKIVRAVDLIMQAKGLVAKTGNRDAWRLFHRVESELNRVLIQKARRAGGNGKKTK